jgi:hypothetical protein
MCSTNQNDPPADETGHNNGQMGPQSQRRLTLQERTHQLQSRNKGYQRNKTQVRTDNGKIAFDSVKRCIICKARSKGQQDPHKGHHKLCWNNTRTKGLLPAELARRKEDKTSGKCLGCFIWRAMFALCGEIKHHLGMFSSSHGFSILNRKITTTRMKTSCAHITSGEPRNF